MGPGWDPVDPETWTANEPHEHSESCESKIALASNSALCTKLHATQLLARDVSTLLLSKFVRKPKTGVEKVKRK